MKLQSNYLRIEDTPLLRKAPHIVQGFSKAAFFKVIAHKNQLQFGIYLEKPFEGSFIQTFIRDSADDKLILSYDENLALTSNNTNPLTLKLRNNYYGIEILGNTLRIKKDEHCYYFGTGQEKWWEGIEKILEEIDERDFDAVERLLALYQAQDPDSRAKIEWWETVVGQHCQFCSWSAFADLYEGFEYFAQEYQNLIKKNNDPKLSPYLPRPCPLEEIKNLQVGLARLLDILRNASNLKEQIEALPGLKLSPVGAHYASQYEDYKLVNAEMLHGAEKRDEIMECCYLYIQSYSLHSHALSTKQHYTQLCNGKRKAANIHLLCHCYVGLNQYRADAHFYKKYFSLLQAHDDSNDSPYQYLRYTKTNISQIFASIALATTHQRGSLEENYNQTEAYLQACLKWNNNKEDKVKLNFVMDICIHWREIGGYNQELYCFDSQLDFEKERANLLDSYNSFIYIQKGDKIYINLNGNLHHFKYLNLSLLNNRDSQPLKNINGVIQQNIDNHTWLNRLILKLVRDANKNTFSGTEKSILDRLSINIPELTLNEHFALVQFLMDCYAPIYIPMQASHLYYLATEYKEYLLKALTIWQANPKHIAPAGFLSLTNELYKPNYEKSLKNKLLVILAAVSEEADGLLMGRPEIFSAFLKALDQCGALKSDILDILSLLDVKRSSSIPTVSCLTKTIEELDLSKYQNNPNAYHLLWQELARNLNCRFDVNQRPTFETHHLGGYFNKLDLSEKSKKICISLLEDHFNLDNPHTIKVFVDKIKILHKKWPFDIENLLETLSFTTHLGMGACDFSFTLNLLDACIYTAKGKPKLKLELLSSLLSYSQLTELDQTRIELILSLFRNNNYSDRHKKKIFSLLCSTMISTEQIFELNNLIDKLNEISDQCSLQFLSILNSILNTENNEELQKTIRNSFIINQIFDQFTNNHSRQKFYQLLALSPQHYNDLIERFNLLSLERQNKIIKISLKASKIKSYSYASLITLIEALSKQTSSILTDLAQCSPSPEIEELIQHLKSEHEIKTLINRYLALKYDDSRALEVIESIIAISRDQPLLYSHRKQLGEWFSVVNNYGYKTPIMEVPNTAPEFWPKAKDLSDQQLFELAQVCKLTLENKNLSNKERISSFLCFLALAREAMQRATELFPYETQIITALNLLRTDENLGSEVNTGEGKGVISALMAVIEHLKGRSVQVTTSNLVLAKRDSNLYAFFFKLLGIEHKIKPIDSKSTISDYCKDRGVEYSTHGALELSFANMQKEDPLNARKLDQRCTSLILDEMDYPLLDDRTIHRYAINLHSENSSLVNVFEWVYPLINQFITTAEFKNADTGFEQVSAAKQRLMKKAKKLNLPPALINKMDNKQIYTWLSSAQAADALEENVEYAVFQAKLPGSDSDELYSFARILSSDQRVNDDSQWSNGVHQFLHARLNADLAANPNPKRKPFPIQAETAAISASSSKTFFDRYKKRGGRVCGLSGTPTGSNDETKELREKYQLKMYRIPPHRPSKRMDHPPILAKNEKEQHEKILAEVIKRLRQNQRWCWRRDGKPKPILIHCKNIKSSKIIHALLAKELAKERYKTLRAHLGLYNGVETILDGVQLKASEEEIIDLSGLSRWVMVSTLIFTRGVDIKPRLKRDDQEQTHPEGLFVLETFIAPPRPTNQGLGRAGRQGHPGETMIIANQENLFYKTGSDQEKIQTQQEVAIRKDKKARLFQEAQTDIKNYFFDHFIQFYYNNPHENLIFRSWGETFNSMDQAWLKLEKEHGKQLENLQNCVSAFIPIACEIWNQQFSEKIIKIVPNEVEAAIKPKPVLALSPSYNKANSLMKISKADFNSQRLAVDYPSPALKSEVAKTYLEQQRKEAFYIEISKLCGATINEENQVEILKAKLGQVFQSIDQVQINPLKHASDCRLYTKLVELLNWSQQPCLLDLIRELHKDDENNDSDDIKLLMSRKLLSTAKILTLYKLKDYQNNSFFRLSDDRKENVAELIQQIENENNLDLKLILQKITTAKAKARLSDQEANLKPRLFRRNILSSRYESTLNNLETSIKMMEEEQNGTYSPLLTSK